MNTISSRNAKEETDELKKSMQVFSNIVNTTNISFYDVASRRLDALSKIYIKKDDGLKSKGERYKDFSKLFKTNFFITGIFCLTVLILSGFLNSPSYREFALSSIVLISLFIIPYNVFFCILSFTKKIERSISIAFPIIFTIIIFFICHYYSKDKNLFFNLEGKHIYPLENIIFLSIFSAIFPFILHVIRVIIYKYIYKFLIYVNRTFIRAYQCNIQENLEGIIGVNVPKKYPLHRKWYYKIIYDISENKRRNRKNNH